MGKLMLNILDCFDDYFDLFKKQVYFRLFYFAPEGCG